MIHGIIGFLYRQTTFYPQLQEKVALLGDAILTRIERHGQK